MSIKSFKYSLHRYTDLFLLSFIALAICVLLTPPIKIASSKIIAYISFLKLSVVTAAVINLLIGCLIWGVLIRLGGFRYKDIWSINTLRYPPLWVFAIASGFLYLFGLPYLSISELESGNTDYSLELIGLTSAFLITSATIAEITFSIFRQLIRISPGDNVSLRQDTDDNQDPLIKWIQEERPIEDDKDDRFDLAPFARRIARLLYERPFKTIGIIGPYGCGKSSIIRMVEQYRKNPDDLKQYLSPTHKVDTTQHLLACYVAGWGLRKGSAAHHILNVAIKELSKQVDCLGLIDLPIHYTSAVAEMASKWGKAVQSITGSKKDPVEILNDLDRVLIAINKRLVIYLEDLDRMEDVSIFRDEIAALLDRLKNLKNVSFVLAIEQEKGTIGILARILDHIETVPLLPREEIVKSIWSFRKICIETYTDDIYPLSTKARDEQFGLYSSSDNEEPVLSKGLIDAERVYSPADAVVRLLISPRLTKFALRRTHQTWETLHGEIDFDDLLIVNILRSSAPEAFAFLIDNIQFIRGIKERSLWGTDSKDKIAKLEGLWEGYTKNTMWDQAAAKFLIDHMFGCWGKSFSNRWASMQDVDMAAPTDYWVRLNAEEVPLTEIKDQDVLKAIELYKKKQEKAYKDMSLPEAISTVKGFAEKVEQFGIRLSSESVYNLAHDVFGLILEQGHIGIDIRNFNGFIGLWRLHLDKGVADYDWLTKEIERALPVSLHFANSIYYYWRHSTRTLRDSDPTPELRAAFIEKAKHVYEANPDALIKAINPHFPYSVYQFAILYSGQRYGEVGFNPDDWIWLADLLLAAGEKNPQIIVPEIVWLFCKPPHMDGTHEFHKEQAMAFFKDKIKSVMSLIATGIDVRDLSEVNKRNIEFAQKEAEKWLLENEQAPKHR